jgi:hypothetical protein
MHGMVSKPRTAVKASKRDARVGSQDGRATLGHKFSKHILVIPKL